MAAVVCKTCHETSSVPQSTRQIRCRGCMGIITIGDRQIPESSGKSSSPDQDQNDVTREGKGLRRLYQKISSNVCQRTTAVSLKLCPSVRISDASPRGKRALLCGVSYKNKKFRLRGTTQDVMNMGNLLIDRFDFPANSILILAEEGQYELPTKTNILRAFDWLMKDLQSGDSLVFYFSGHGLRQLEFEGDETDGFDEAICPLDFETEGLILDNDINKTIVTPLKQGVTLHAVIDSCHSGTVLDLPYVYDPDKAVWNNNHPPFKGTNGGLAICFSACEDHQQAADTTAFSAEKTMAGAMTHNFIRAIMDIPNVTYLGILNYMCNAIERANNEHHQRKCVRSGMLRFFNRKMLQDPMLSSSQAFNVNKQFKLQHF